ncbi:alanine racemase [Neochlamydia sp. AcF95]|uniref:alanine racemase n=1 Tax=Neochlamydia sp. AcF95 TaxID=2795734 RepID=UPI001BC9A821|nr:alanine racemase [Neochlamydia sp. AcF95]MBS4169977.1 Uncharacterized protein [Neochlamydia sp. AcF95]
MDPFDLRLWEGFSAALSSPCIGSPIIDQICIDSRLISSPHALFVALPGQIEDGHHYVEHAAIAGARFAIVRNDWQPAKLPAINLLRVLDPLKAFQEIATAYRHQLKALIVGITGTHGKTMVKDLLQAMIAPTKRVIASPGSFNSQVGVPLSILNISQQHEIALIEAAVSQDNEMDRLAKIIHPQACILTHIGKKHLITFGNQQALVAETIKLITVPPENKWALIPETPFLEPYLKQIKAPYHFWNKETPFLPHAHLLSKPYEVEMLYGIKFPCGTYLKERINAGFYYFMDLLNISVKAAWLLGVSAKIIQEALCDYILEPMRTEIWKSPIGATFINETYSSDPQSVDQALKHFEHSSTEHRRIFIFGGIRGKKENNTSEYRRIGHALIKNKVQMLALVGSHNFQEIINIANKAKNPLEICHYNTYRDALQQMQAHIQCNDYVVIKNERKEPLNNLIEIFNDSIASNQCFINLAAIQSNIATIRHKVGANTRLMVMVKALAYGTEEIRIGKFLSTCGVDILGVSCVEEGVALKRAGIKQAVFVIHSSLYEIAKIVKWELEVGVSEKEFITALANEASKQNKSIRVHLHVDTGMNRLGCSINNALELATLIKDCPHLILEGLMTHFACADDPAQDFFTFAQTQSFDGVIAQLKKHQITANYYHASNSSAVVRFDFNQYNMVRVGLAIYGLHCSEAARQAMELRLALTLVSRIAGINYCKAGDTISYGRSYRVERDKQVIAVLPIGYFDGLHRHYSGKGYVLIRGQKAPMVGKICMDFMMVDVTGIENVAIGDAVLIFGEDEHGQYLAPEEVALQGDSIVHELITCLGPRIQRIFIHEESNQKS